MARPEYTAEFETDPFFGLAIPNAVPGVPTEVLNPRNSWQDKDGYDKTAKHLVSLFEKNFETFAGAVSDEVKAAALKSAA